MSKTPRQQLEEKFPSEIEVFDSIFNKYGLYRTLTDHEMNLLCQMRSQCLDIAEKEIENVKSSLQDTIIVLEAMCAKKRAEIEERDKLLEELREALLKNNNELNTLIDHCVEQGHIDYDDETDGIKDFRAAHDIAVKSLQSYADFLKGKGE